MYKKDGKIYKEFVSVQEISETATVSQIENIKSDIICKQKTLKELEKQLAEIKKLK